MNLTQIAAHYDAFIIDLWGVIHDGTSLYPGVAEALASLAPKPVVFLSNAPRRSHKVETVLDGYGIARTHYHKMITSGEIAFERLKADKTFARYYYLGPSKDEDILIDLPSYRNAPLEEAEFVMNTGYEYDFQPHGEVRPLLKKLIDRNLPLICVNPDMEVVKQDGTQMLCAGTLAAAYARMGGAVEYIGKPHANAYDAAKKHLKSNAKILMIGDNPDTDIAGAVGANIDSLLITGGVLKVRHGRVLNETDAREICPDATHVLPAFTI
ncbi:MAG: TIGR01459 family HAD-type hydrolase [Rickettsiales bacterium]